MNRRSFIRFVAALPAAVVVAKIWPALDAELTAIRIQKIAALVAITQELLLDSLPLTESVVSADLLSGNWESEEWA